MFSPTFAPFRLPLAPFSPKLDLGSPKMAHADASPSTDGSAPTSPPRLPVIPKSSSGNDLVSGIVDKFNSLSVMDRDEERAMFERQIAKLKAALERACMAREEAESEARRWREKQGEWERERAELKGKVGEWERKYEKAKDRFKLQKAKNEDAMHKVHAEFLEKEKDHWRSVAVAQEAEEWERKLRLQADDLLDFVELERGFEPPRLASEPPASHARATVHEDVLIDFSEPATARLPSEDGTERYLTPDERPAPASRELTPDGPPMLAASHPAFLTPARRVVVSVDFGEGCEDKENEAPAPALLRGLPVTIDRAAALAAIEYRRGRARSCMNAQVTPRAVSVVDKRDVSAPALVTMSVGRA